MSFQRHGVSSQWQFDCLFNHLIRLTSKTTSTVYPKKYAHGFCFAVLCCGYTLTDFPISIRLTSLALWQSNDCPSASKATLMNMDKYFMWIHYERLHNHNKAKHNKTVCIFLGIYCKFRITGPLWVEYIQQFPHKGSVFEWRQISVMSNHRHLDYSFNSLSRLITKDKSKLCTSGSLWGESGDRGIPLGKSRQFKKRFRAY